MKIAVLGTGAGGRAHAGALAALGHQVVIGTRDPQATLARTEGDPMIGLPPFKDWYAEHAEIPLLTFADAAAQGDLVINGIDGRSAVAALTPLRKQLAGKVLIDYGVPMVYNPGYEHPWPAPWGEMPGLDPVESDSLGEQIQRALPDARVVKSFVTQVQDVVVDPKSVGGGDHVIFVSGDDVAAKQAVTQLLQGYGWTQILDLGGIASARAQEMYSHIHTAIGIALGDMMTHWGLKIVR
ncbi:NADPH-dependent F420 reductase [Nocardia huaxiensis]|uniref:NADPH-dependent F420 reductase n=1 Tax=Nocardia huaxiensis TaxID=2755382 RepID=UPI001E4B3A37|nr:NAD(P)-binding domain-containing protein [Nocardia huaxiensis]UFS98184.1 NAD(P)-binding domain-containing protein [Nocardia huaxiensis]